MSRRAAQQPQDLSFAAEIAGAAAQPIATQGRSYRGQHGLQKVGPSLAEQISPVANGGCPLDPDKDVALPSTHVERVAASFSFRCIAE